MTLIEFLEQMARPDDVASVLTVDRILCESGLLSAKAQGVIYEALGFMSPHELSGITSGFVVGVTYALCHMDPADQEKIRLADKIGMEV